MKNPEKLIGKKIKGFRYKSTKDILWSREMSNYIGIDGIIEFYGKEYNCFRVDFGDNFFYYPADKIEAHLVDEENEIPTLSDGNELEYLKRHEKLNQYILEMASTGKIPNNWSDFLFELNNNLVFKSTKEEQLTAILGSSDKVKEIMEVFNCKE